MAAIRNVLRLIAFFVVCWQSTVVAQGDDAFNRLSVVDVDLRLLYVSAPMDSATQQKFSIASRVFLEKHISSSTTEIVHLETTVSSQELDNLPSVTNNNLFPMSLSFQVQIEYKAGRSAGPNSMEWKVKSSFKDNSEDFIDMLLLLNKEYFSKLETINVESSVDLSPPSNGESEEEEPYRDDYSPFTPINDDRGNDTRSLLSSPTTLIIIVSIVSLGIALGIAIAVPALRRRSREGETDHSASREGSTKGTDTDISKNSSSSETSSITFMDSLMMSTRNVQPIFREDEVVADIRERKIVLETNVKQRISEMQSKLSDSVAKEQDQNEAKESKSKVGSQSNTETLRKSPRPPRKSVKSVKEQDGKNDKPVSTKTSEDRSKPAQNQQGQSKTPTESQPESGGVTQKQGERVVPKNQSQESKKVVEKAERKNVEKKEEEESSVSQHPYHQPVLNRPMWIDNHSIFDSRSFRSVSTITGAMSFDEEMGESVCFEDSVSKGCSTVDTIQTTMRKRWDDEDADDFGSIAGSLPSPTKNRYVDSMFLE